VGHGDTWRVRGALISEEEGTDKESQPKEATRRAKKEKKKKKFKVSQ
jgi:hypothetical protein